MITPDAEPISNKTPYPRVDIAHVGRKRRITLQEWVEGGRGREPDPAAYGYDCMTQSWLLKDSG